MILKVYVIYDSKAEAYLPPFMMKNKGECIRAITEHVNDPKHNFCKYAEDFTIFELGTWDDSTSKYTFLNTPHSLGVFVEFKRNASAEKDDGEASVRALPKGTPVV